MKFLMGLDESYKNIKAQVLMMKPFPSLNEVYSIMQREEKRREISSDLCPNRAMTFGIKDYDRNAKTSVAGKEKLYCSHCKATGHSLEKC